MPQFTVYNSFPGEFTFVSNRFLDVYMPSANGEFVKIYLYLLRNCSREQTRLELSCIADAFNCTEADIVRALKYWKKAGILDVSFNSRGTLTDVVFYPLPAKGGDLPLQPDRHRTSEAAAAKETAASSPVRTALSPDKLKQLKGNEEVRQLLFIAEQYLGKTLTSTDMETLLYLYDEVHMSADLLEYLIEYCVSKGCTGPRYMEKVAQEWYKSGITTVAQAKADSSLFNKNYFTIFHALGIKGRNPAPVEMEYMDRWLDEYGFTIEIILEACCRTIRQTHQPNFQYADKILEQWHRQGVRQLSDIDRLDAAHSAKAARMKEAGARPAPKAASNRFNNFPQREYDWKALEQQLLNARGGTTHRKEVQNLGTE